MSGFLFLFLSLWVPYHLAMANLLYAGNDKMFDGILSSLLSIASNTTRGLDVIILTADFTEIREDYRPIDERMRVFLERVLQFYCSTSTVRLVDLGEVVKKDLADSKNKKNRFSPYAVLRLYLDSIEDLPDRILYLDTDTLAKGDISPLYDLDLRGNYIGMALDAVGSIWLTPEYCNSGVLLMDYGKIRQSNLLELCRNLVKTQFMFMPDQTALNTLFDDKIYFLPREYNEQKKTQDNTLIRHFCDVMHLFPILHVDKVKQWDVERVHSVLKERAFDAVLETYLELKKLYLDHKDPEEALIRGHH